MTFSNKTATTHSQITNVFNKQFTNTSKYTTCSISKADISPYYKFEGLSSIKISNSTVHDQIPKTPRTSWALLHNCIHFTLTSYHTCVSWLTSYPFQNQTTTQALHIDPFHFSLLQLKHYHTSFHTSHHDIPHNIYTTPIKISPTLFNIYTSDIPSPKHIQHQAYVDNITITATYRPRKHAYDHTYTSLFANVCIHMVI